VFGLAEIWCFFFRVRTGVKTIASIVSVLRQLLVQTVPRPVVPLTLYCTVWLPPLGAIAVCRVCWTVYMCVFVGGQISPKQLEMEIWFQCCTYRKWHQKLFLGRYRILLWNKFNSRSDVIVTPCEVYLSWFWEGIYTDIPPLLRPIGIWGIEWSHDQWCIDAP